VTGSALTFQALRFCPKRFALFHPGANSGHEKLGFADYLID
jgi:hypothetical protein